MTYNDLVKYADTIFARKFEGLDFYYEFSDDQIHDIFETNKWAQIYKFSDKARKAWMSKIFLKPIKHIDEIISSMTSQLVHNNYTTENIYNQAMS